MPSPAAAALRSHPALKNRSPAAVRMPTRSLGSLRSRLNAAYSALLVVTSIAFAFGRSRVTTRICPSTRACTGSGAPTLSPPVRSKQRAGDDLALDLAGTVPDPLHPGITPPALDRQLGHQAHAAENLYRRVGHPAEHLRCVQLGHRRVGVGHRAPVQLGGGAQGQHLRRLQLGSPVGELEPDPLEPADRLAELPPAR